MHYQCIALVEDAHACSESFRARLGFTEITERLLRVEKAIREYHRTFDAMLRCEKHTEKEGDPSLVSCCVLKGAQSRGWKMITQILLSIDQILSQLTQPGGPWNKLNQPVTPGSLLKTAARITRKDKSSRASRKCSGNHRPPNSTTT